MQIRLERVLRLAKAWVVCAVAAAGMLLPPGATAEIYKWKDASGRLHFAQDLNQVPLEYRSQARGGALDGEGSDPVQRYQAPPTSPSRRTRKAITGRKRPGQGRVHRIRVEQVGSTMRVNVRLNGRVTAPFYVDTGATDVVLPLWVAKDLGLELEGARTGFYSTANGTIKQSLVTLDSVELGGARAERVPAAVNESMSTGLLGLSFFNHFRYRFDPGSGVITLEENGLAEAGTIRGGRSRQQWQRQFALMAQHRAAIERALDEINPNWSRRKAELEAELEELDRQLDVLEDEADEARVPMQWRD